MHRITQDPRQSINPSLLQKPDPLFEELRPEKTGIDYAHREVEYVDFKRTALLTQLYSKGGPGAAVADVDGNGLDDLFFGADAGEPRFLYRQTSAGRFIKQPLFTALNDDMGAVFFDADGDQDPDLYVVSGGSRYEGENSVYQDRLYRNDQGKFTLAVAALPPTLSSGSSVVAADYDRDGDLDLFRAGRLLPGQYPTPARSYLLQNNGGTFTDVTAKVAPALLKPGLVCAALWTDYDNDGWIDLALAGEWMPLSFYRNQKGTFALSEQVTDPRGQPMTGWFNSIAGADFDRDGDIDYMLGNLGENTKYRTSSDKPLELHVSDYDQNGRLDPVLMHYIGNTQYPVPLRDVMVDQMVATRRRFTTYAEYAKADYQHTFTRQEAESATVMPVRTLSSLYIENRAGSKGTKFQAKPLPLPAQVSTVFGLQTGDFNADGFVDALLVGNHYALDPQTGRNDAGYGLVLLGDGKGHFRPLSPGQSGIIADGDAKSLVRTGDLFIATNNNRRVQVFRSRRPTGAPIPLKTDDVAVLLTYMDGRKERRERYFGSGYLSQSDGVFYQNAGVVAVDAIDRNGRLRRL